MVITQWYGLHVVWLTSMHITPPTRFVGVCRRVHQLVAEVDILDVKALKPRQVLLLPIVANGGNGGVVANLENKLQRIRLMTSL